jgi:hypothetical protein
MTGLKTRFKLDFKIRESCQPSGFRKPVCVFGNPFITALAADRKISSS